MSQPPDGSQLAAPLEGVVVLDFTRYLSGPFATMLLRDLGARVIKIESGGGDPAREAGPFVSGDSAYFHPINRGKDSVHVELRDPEQVGRLRELLSSVDCLVENFRPGVMEDVGLGPRQALASHPQLVYASCSGFGAEGPYAQRPAFDVVAQAMGGVMSVTGKRPGEPTRVGVSQGDIVAGIYLTVGVLSALVRRDRIGAGCYIDLSMHDCQLALVTHALGIRVATGEDPQIIGNRHPAVAPFDVYETADGWAAIAASTDAVFTRLCEVLGLHDLVEDERFATGQARLANVDDLTALIAEAAGEWKTAALVDALLDRRIPCGPVATMSDLLTDPHLAARGSLADVRPWGDDALAVPAVPFRLDGQRLVTRTRAPDLGSLSLDDLEAVLRR